MSEGSHIAAVHGGLPVLARELANDWVCERLHLPDDDRLVGHFRMHSGVGFLRVTVSSGPARGRVYRRLRHCHIAYEGEIAQMTESARLGVRVAVEGLGEWIDGCLEVVGGGSIAHALGRRPQAGDVAVLDDELLRDLFGHLVADQHAPSHGWAIEDVYPASRNRGGSASPHDWVIEFRHQDTRLQSLYVVGPRVEGRRTLGRTEHFDLVHRAAGQQTPHDVVNLGAVLGLILQLRDHEDLELILPDTREPLRLPVLDPANYAEERPGESLNIALDTECGQRCSFCSVKESRPPEDGGYEQFVQICDDIATHRARGIVAMRLNGYDPLTFSHVLELMSFAVEAGIERLEVFSPCTRLADDEFRRAFLACVPDDTRVFVPLYGTTAEVHDAVVGVPGAFDRVMVALDRLREELGPQKVSILSVVTRTNLDAAAALASFAAERDVSFSVHLPYPSGAESKADAFHRAAPRQSDVVAALAPVIADAESHLTIEGLAPCVLFAHMRDLGVPARAWLRPRSEPKSLPGTEYLEAKYHQSADALPFAAGTVPCPHVERCALGPGCYQQFLRAYVELYGMDEFVPVALTEVLRVADPDAPEHAYRSHD